MADVIAFPMVNPILRDLRVAKAEAFETWFAIAQVHGVCDPERIRAWNAYVDACNRLMVLERA